MSDTKKARMHPLKAARTKLNFSQEHLAEVVELSVSTIKRAERGASIGAYARQKLCKYFGMSAEKLGLVDQEHEEAQVTEVSKRLPVFVAPSLSTHKRYIADPSDEQRDEDHAYQPGLWLALSAIHLAPLFEAGLSIESLLESLHIVLRGIQAMPTISRRTLLQMGTATIMSGIPTPTGKRISPEERAQLHKALGESIAAGWKLFHLAGNTQILAIGQAQRYMVQHVSSDLYPSVRPLLYSGVYRLIGAALHFQGRYSEAYQAHEQAYIAALEGGDAWNMAQSRSWQAYGLKALERYADALETTDGALRLIAQQNDTESIRLRARLLAFGAENAALLGDEMVVQQKLNSSEKLLEYLPGHHEEFDRASWLQQAGVCALNLGHYDFALRNLQQALDDLPIEWTLRSVVTAVPLASTLTRMNEQDRALALVEKTLPAVKTAQSQALTQIFINYLQREFLARFSHDRRCQTFVAEAQQQLLLA